VPCLRKREQARVAEGAGRLLCHTEAYELIAPTVDEKGRREDAFGLAPQRVLAAQGVRVDQPARGTRHRVPEVKQHRVVPAAGDPAVVGVAARPLDTDPEVVVAHALESRREHFGHGGAVDDGARNGLKEELGGVERHGIRLVKERGNAHDCLLRTCLSRTNVELDVLEARLGAAAKQYQLVGFL
jgi:hypothetical protein